MHIHATADKAVVRVTDNGWGICKKDQKQIFKQFYRVLHKQNPKGFGIGLVLAKYIVEAHHGKITVESELDKGSTFGGFTLNKETNNLYDRQRHATHLTNKQTQVLEILIAHQGEIVPREILKKELWQDGNCSDASLDNYISQLRKICSTDDSIKIETVPKKGFLLTIL